MRTYGVCSSSRVVEGCPCPSAWLGQQHRRLTHGDESQGARDVEPCQHQQDRVEAGHRGHAVRGDAADDAAKGAGRGDAAVGRACRGGVEALGDERPEAGQQQCADTGQVQVDDDRHPPSRPEGDPLEHVPRGAEPESKGDDGKRREAGEEPREERDQRQHQRRGGERHHGQRRGRPGAEKRGVAKRLRATWCASMMPAVLIATVVSAMGLTAPAPSTRTRPPVSACSTGGAAHLNLRLARLPRAGAGVTTDRVG